MKGKPIRNMLLAISAMGATTSNELGQMLQAGYSRRDYGESLKSKRRGRGAHNRRKTK